MISFECLPMTCKPSTPSLPSIDMLYIVRVIEIMATTLQ